MRKIKSLLHKLGYWFFCKIDDPVFSPSSTVIGDVVCIHCRKQHGTLTNERAAAYMFYKFVEVFYPPPKKPGFFKTLMGKIRLTNRCRRIAMRAHD